MAKQFTIIDGYNVLHECGFVTSNVAPGELEKARDRFLGIIAQFVAADDRARTTVVFDSQEPNLPNRFERNGILVEFAIDHEDADQLIEQLIAKHSAAKQLTVVSSDHRLHKAARTKGATPIDSGDWLDGIQRPKRAGSNSGESLATPADSKERLIGQTDVDVDYWMSKMDADVAEIERSITETPAIDPRFKKQAKPKGAPADNLDGDNGQQNETSADDVGKGELPSSNPFPPGYADDLFE